MSDNINFEGFDELLSTVRSLGQVGNKINNKALKEGSKIVLAEQKRQAPVGENNSREKLTTGNIKKYKNGNAYLSVGITKDNWEECKGLWFQNFNGIHSSGKHVGWISKAYEKVKSKATDAMMKVVSDEVDKILK